MLRRPRLSGCLTVSGCPYRLRYNNVTKTTENADGVEIRVVGFGNSSSVEYLDSSRVGLCE